MKVIIAGSRTFRDGFYLDLVNAAVKLSGYQIDEVVCGGSEGIDLQGSRWADACGIQVRMMPADWKVQGKWAGPIRNADMAAYADALILIWDGVSTGSADMLRKAIDKGMPCYQIVLERLHRRKD